MRAGYPTNGTKELLNKISTILEICEKFGFDKVDGNLSLLYIYNSYNEKIVVSTQLSGYTSIKYQKSITEDAVFLTCNPSELEQVFPIEL